MNQPNRDAEQLKESIAAGYEKRDLSIRAIVIFIVALVVMLALIFVVSSGIMLTLTGKLPPFPVQGLANAPTPPLPPQPRLEAVPGVQNEQLVKDALQQLNSYGWVDQKAGIVHIPIDRAMEVLLQQGLPVRQQPSTPYQDQGVDSPSGPSSGQHMEKYP